MNYEEFSLPDLTQEEQVIFHNAFAKDLENLNQNAAISSSFCDLIVTIYKTPSISLLTEKESQSILHLSDLQSKREAVLKCANEKGPRALVVFYLLLHRNDEIAYGKLPSCKENDKKMPLISKLSNKSLPSLENKVAEKVIKHRQVVKIEEQHLKRNRRTWGVQKNDIFFHFITLCFALGTVLVVEHYYADWTVAAGIGLMSFAALEAIGIYFNFVNRIRSIARAIIKIVLRWAEKFPKALKNR